MEETTKPSSQTIPQLAEIRAAARAADSAHFRLVLVAGSSSYERSKILRRFSAQEGCPFVNVGRSLSEMLLEVSAPYRAASAEDCFSELLETNSNHIACLDRLEILHEPDLKLIPWELLKNASRHRTLISSWPGRSEGGHLVFGTEGHPAYRRVARAELEAQFIDLAP